MDATTNQVYNIDNIDISQFTQIHLVDHIQQNAGENPETQYTLTAVVEDIEEVKVKQEDENDTAAKPPEPVEEHDKMNSNVVAEPGEVKDCGVIPCDPTPVEDHDIMHSEGVAKPTVVNNCDIIPSDPTLVEDHDIMHSDSSAEPGVDKDSDVIISHVVMKPPGLEDGILSAVVESEIELLSVKKGEGKCAPEDNGATCKSDTMMESNSDVTALKDNDVEIIDHSDTTKNESSSDGLKGNNCYKTKKTEGESNSDVILLNDASDTTEKEGEAEERTKSEVEESVRLSPDESSVKISNKKLTVVDKPPRLRSETRGQYTC